MERDIYQKLKQWKDSSNRKPLVLQGARQTGKTYILKQFGTKEYDSLVYCNFEEEPLLKDFFTADLRPQRIIETLTLYKKQEIRPGRDLLFFDEIQVSNGALNSLKYFCEDAPQYHVVAAGSLLGLRLSTPSSFPVGKVTLMDLFPMTMLEFLDAIGQSAHRKMLEGIERIEPIEPPLHEQLVQMLKSYYFVGGMPEAVAQYAISGSYSLVRSIQTDILRTYALDFAKHAATLDHAKLTAVWDSIPSHLARENKKFIFSAVAKSGRGREYESSLQWLKDTGLINIAYRVKTISAPLSGFTDRSMFKVYSLDTGLLGAMARLSPETIVMGDNLFTIFNGCLVENYAAQQLCASGMPLYYWKSEHHASEIDFLIEQPSSILPLEVKAGVNPKSKSLRSFADKYKPRMLLRSSLLNLMRNGEILNIPLYAINVLEKLLTK